MGLINSVQGCLKSFCLVGRPTKHIAHGIPHISVNVMIIETPTSQGPIGMGGEWGTNNIQHGGIQLHGGQNSRIKASNGSGGTQHGVRVTVQIDVTTLYACSVTSGVQHARVGKVHFSANTAVCGVGLHLRMLGV